MAAKSKRARGAYAKRQRACAKKRGFLTPGYFACLRAGSKTKAKKAGRRKSRR